MARVVEANLFLLLRLVTEDVRVRRDASVPPSGGEDDEILEDLRNLFE